MSRAELPRVARFIAVNGLATGADLLIVMSLRHGFGAPWLIAVASGFAANLVVGLALNRTFVFEDGHSTLFEASWRYAVLAGVNVAIGVLGVTMLVSYGWNYLLTRLLSSVALVALNYVTARRWVFAVPSDTGPLNAATR